MYVFIVLKRSCNVYYVRSSHIVITVRALVVVVVIVSLSFFCNYLCIVIYQYTLRNIIYCIGNDRHANCSPRKSMVRGSAAQAVDGNMRMRAPGFLFRAFPLLVRH